MSELLSTGAGYKPEHVRRVFVEGVPEASQAILLDSILHGGYGKQPIFKHLLSQIDLEAEARKRARDALLRNTAKSDSEHSSRSKAMLKSDSEHSSRSKMRQNSRSPYGSQCSDHSHS